MAPIYSTQLHNAAHAGVFNAVVYTVPAGSTVVVTDLDVLFSATVAGQLTAVVLGAVTVIRHVAAAAEVINIQWVGKQVLTAGQTILLVGTGASVQLAATGYLLAP